MRNRGTPHSWGAVHLVSCLPPRRRCYAARPRGSLEERLRVVDNAGGFAARTLAALTASVILAASGCADSDGRANGAHPDAGRADAESGGTEPGGSSGASGGLSTAGGSPAVGGNPAAGGSSAAGGIASGGRGAGGGRGGPPPGGGGGPGGGASPPRGGAPPS